MTRRSDKYDCCVYEYINRTVSGAAVHRNRQNKYCDIIGREYTQGLKLAVAHSPFASKFQCGPLKISCRPLGEWKLEKIK